MTAHEAREVSPVLAGIRIVSLAINLPGPLAASRLAGLGAEVLKVEPPAGDPLAMVVPGWYDELHRGVRVSTLDLKQADDRARLHEHLAGADLLLTAQRPSALSRLGLDGLTETHPRLVHVEIVGHDGDLAEVPGHDLTYQAEHGTLQPPAMPVVPVADTLGAERAVSTALAALIARTRTGTGGRHRVVLDDAAHAAGAAVRHGLMGPGAPLGGTLPTYRIYASADGHVALGALEPHFAARVHDHLGRSAEELETAFAGAPTTHWEQLAAQLDIPLAGIHTHPGGTSEHP